VRHRPGIAYWIDHFTLGTEDLERFIDFHARVFGAPLQTPQPPGMAFMTVSACHHGGFLQRSALPTPARPGNALPRYAYFVRKDDLEEHVRRLDANGVPHTSPIRTAAEGADGLAVRFVDLDGNQFEFWAPDELPEGAMAGSGPLKIGRISHIVYESRDLARTATFFERYCALQALERPGIGRDTLVLSLAAGARLVYERVEQLGGRTSGHGVYRDLHTALVVRDDDFWPSYEPLWANLPDWEFDARRDAPPQGAANLPARTALHGSPAGHAWKRAFGRGDDWYDWDTNLFHYYVGKPVDGTMTHYEGHTIDDFMEEYLAARGLRLEVPLAELYRKVMAGLPP